MYRMAHVRPPRGPRFFLGSTRPEWERHAQGYLGGVQRATLPREPFWGCMEETTLRGPAAILFISRDASGECLFPP